MGVVSALVWHDSATIGFVVWLLTITVVPIVMSIAAAIQYRRSAHTGAGAAAAAVYWALFVVLFFHAAELFFFGALLQTAAWFISRPRVKMPV